MNLIPFDLEKAKADPSRVVQRCGLPVRGLVFDFKHETHPIVGIRVGEHGDEHLNSWTSAGKWHSDREANLPQDLMLLPRTVKVEVWKAEDGHETLMGETSLQRRITLENNGNKLIGQAEIEVDE